MRKQISISGQRRSNWERESALADKRLYRSTAPQSNSNSNKLITEELCGVAWCSTEVIHIHVAYSTFPMSQ